jgi:hypothetical protein
MEVLAVTSPGPAETMRSLDLASDPLAVVSQTASAVLNAHTDEMGRCVVCQTTWPCEQATLAEHHLAGI